jgi:hypothetical protein
MTNNDYRTGAQFAANFEWYLGKVNKNLPEGFDIHSKQWHGWYDGFRSVVISRMRRVR